MHILRTGASCQLGVILIKCPLPDFVLSDNLVHETAFLIRDFGQHFFHGNILRGRQKPHHVGVFAGERILSLFLIIEQIGVIGMEQFFAPAQKLAFAHDEKSRVIVLAVRAPADILNLVKKSPLYIYYLLNDIVHLNLSLYQLILS